MKFYMLKDAPVRLYGDLGRGVTDHNYEAPTNNNSGSTTEARKKIGIVKPWNVDLIPMVSEKCNGEFWDMGVVKNCGAALVEALTTERTARKRKRTCSADESNGPLRMAPVVKLFTKRLRDNELIFNLRFMEQGNGLLNKLKNACGHFSLTVELFFKTLGSSSTMAALITKPMPVTTDENGGLICMDEEIKATSKMERYWNQFRGYFEIYATCNVILTVNDDTEIFSDEVSRTDMNKRILEEALAADFEIETDDGAVVKCHKSFLFANSPVFSAMLSADMTEKTSNRLRMPDMSSEALRAFLAYLYYGDTDVAKKNMEVAFELLKAGHMYEVVRLERTMLRLLYNIPDIYFTIEFALQVFMFARKIPNGDKIKEKVMRIIKSDWSFEPDEEYEEILQQDLEAAKELKEFSLKTEQATDEVEEIEID